MTSPLRVMAQALDAAALEALAPKGLVRRAAADVAAGLAAVTAETPDTAEIRADDETVHVTSAGPRQARCSCPASGVCRHRLAALILLRDGAATQSEGPAAIQPETDVIDWSVLAQTFTEARLAKFAGKAAWRDAIQAQARARAARVVQLAGTLQVHLGGGEEIVVFLAAGGLEAALTKVSEKARKGLIVLAALAVRHTLGLPDFEAPPGPGPVPDAESTMEAPDGRTLRAVRDLLQRCYRSALAFAPAALEDEARRLAVAGRVEALPRLSRLLRAIAAGISGLRRRQADADAEGLLALIAESHALTVALEKVTEPTARRVLSGVVRQAYEPMGDLVLFGLGARIWETPAGAHGVTAYFHEPASGRAFRLTQARPDHSDRSFTPQGAFGHTPIWGKTMRELSASQVDLQDALASASGRLSGAQTVLARTTSFRPTPAVCRGWTCAAQDWLSLESRLRTAFSGGLATPGAEEAPVILMATQYAPLRFDELTQTLTWPVADQAGRWIGLSLAHQGAEAARIEALERLAQKERFWAVLAAASPVGDRFELRPYGLLGETQHLLDVADPPPRGPNAGAGTRLIERIKAGLKGALTGNPIFVSGTTHTHRLIDQGWALVLRQAEMGRATSASNGAACLKLATDLEQAGLAGLGAQFRALAAEPNNDDSGLRTAWALLSARNSRKSLAWMATPTH